MSAKESKEDPNGSKIAQEMVPIIHMVRRAVLREKAGSVDLTQEIERIADRLCNLEHFLENYEELQIVSRLKSEIKAQSTLPGANTVSPALKSTDMDTVENDNKHTVSMSALDASQVKSLLRPQSGGSAGSTKWRKGSGLESIRENLLSDIAQSISSMAREDALSTTLPPSSSHNTSNKKQKSHGVSLFDNFNFDDLPPYEPLEACLSLLRNDSTSLPGIHKLTDFDVEELVEHPQWYELIMLLHRALVISREDSVEEMEEVSSMIEAMKDRDGDVEDSEDMKSGGSIASRTAVLTLYMKYIGQLQGQQRVDLVCSLFRYCIERWCPSFHGNNGNDGGIEVSPLTHSREQFDIPLLSKLELSSFSIALQCVFEDMPACPDKSTDTVLCLAMIAMTYGTITVSLMSSNHEGNTVDGAAKMKVLDALGIISDPAAAEGATSLSFPKPQTALLHSLSLGFLSTLIDKLCSLQTVDMDQYKDVHPSQRILLVGSYLHTFNLFMTLVVPYFRQGDGYINRVLSHATDDTLKEKTGTWDGTIAPVLGPDPEGATPMSHTSVDHIRSPLTMLEVAECNRLYLQCSGCHFDIRAFVELPDNDDERVRASYSSNNGTVVDDPDLAPRYSTLPAEDGFKAYNVISTIDLSFGPFLLMVLERMQSMLVSVTYRASLDCLSTLSSLLEHCVNYAQKSNDREAKRRIIMMVRDIVGLYPLEWSIDEGWDGKVQFRGSNGGASTSDEEVEAARSAHMTRVTRCCHEDMLEFYLTQLESLTEAVEDGSAVGEGLLLDLLIPLWLEVASSTIIQEDMKLCQQGLQYCEGGRPIRLRAVFYGWQMVLHMAQGERSIFWQSHNNSGSNGTTIDCTGVGPLLSSMVHHCSICLSQPTLLQDREGVDSLDARHRMALQYFYGAFLLSVLYNFKITQCVFFPISSNNGTGDNNVDTGAVLFQQCVDLLLHHLCKESVVYTYQGDPDHRAELASTLLHVCQDSPLALTTSASYPLLVEWVSIQLEGDTVSELASAWYDSSDTTFSLLQLLISLSFTSTGPVVIHTLLLAAWPAYSQWCGDNDIQSLPQVCSARQDMQALSYEDAYPLLLRVLQVCLMSQSFCIEVMYCRQAVWKPLELRRQEEEKDSDALEAAAEQATGGLDLTCLFHNSVAVQLREALYWIQPSLSKRCFWLPEDEEQMVAVDKSAFRPIGKHDDDSVVPVEKGGCKGWAQREGAMDLQENNSIPEPYTLAHSLHSLPTPPNVHEASTPDTAPLTGLAGFLWPDDGDDTLRIDGDDGRCYKDYCDEVISKTLSDCDGGAVDLIIDQYKAAMQQYIKDIEDYIPNIANGSNGNGTDGDHFASKGFPFLMQCALIFSLSSVFDDLSVKVGEPTVRREHFLQTFKHYLPISDTSAGTIITFLRGMHDQVVHTALSLLFKYDDGSTLGIFRSRHISHRGLAEQVVQQWFGKYLHMDDCLFVTCSCVKQYHSYTARNGFHNDGKHGSDNDEDVIANSANDGSSRVSAVPALVLCLILIRIANGIHTDWRCEGGIEQITRVISTPTYAFRLVDEDVLLLYRKLAEIYSQ